MNDIQNTINKTPIEIALGVGDDGLCTAKKLYEFLELDPKNYSRWCKTNITDNEFATPNEDYWVFVIDEENLNLSGLGGRPSQDYKLTAHFAKKLSMKGNGEKSEMAREYFTIIEERTKQEVLDKSKLSPNTKMLIGLAESIAQAEIEQKRQAERLAKVEQTQEAIKEAVKPVTDNWREEINKKFNRIQKCCGADFKDLRIEMYNQLDERAGADVATRLRNRKERMRLEGSTKSSIDKLNRMDIIECDKKLREIFSKIVTEYEIRFCA